MNSFLCTIFYYYLNVPITLGFISQLKVVFCNAFFFSNIFFRLYLFRNGSSKIIEACSTVYAFKWIWHVLQRLKHQSFSVKEISVDNTIKVTFWVIHLSSWVHHVVKGGRNPLRMYAWPRCTGRFGRCWKGWHAAPTPVEGRWFRFPEGCSKDAECSFVKCSLLTYSTQTVQSKVFLIIYWLKSMKILRVPRLKKKKKNGHRIQLQNKTDLKKKWPDLNSSKNLS